MSVAVVLADLYDDLADGDLDTKGGYAKNGAGGSTFVVNSGTTLEGAKSISLTDGAAGPAAYEKSIGATLAVTAHWRVSWKARVASGAAAFNESFLSLTNGHADAGDRTTTAIRLAMLRNTATVDMNILDAAGGRTLAGAFALDSIPWLRLEILPAGAYALAKSTDAGATWSDLAQGSLVTANRAVSRFHFGNDGVSPHVDATHWYDSFRILAVTDDVKVSLGSRLPRRAVISAAVPNAQNPGMLDLTIDIYDTQTGLIVQPGRTRTVPMAYVDPSPGANSVSRLDAVLEEELDAYDRPQRVATLNAAAHEVTY